jgi:flagellar biosynthetic protein FlhB
MSGNSEDDTEKSYDATPQKLQKARDKGEIARSADLSVAAGYAGFLLTAFALGVDLIQTFCSRLMVLIDQSHNLAPLFFEGHATAPMAGLMAGIATASLPWFAVPAIAVLASIIAQKGFVVAPEKIQPKISRISLTSNAKNKFGRSGLFEFLKSFFKLTLYSACVALFLRERISEIIASAAEPGMGVVLMGRLIVEFLCLAVLISSAVGVVDAFWQHKEHQRKNMMSRKEMLDETKDAEGDPYFKQHRRQKGQEIALSQMMADVPNADVVIVNPTHYAVALKWNRTPGSAPICVAKGVDEIALAIRKSATLSGVPIHDDPPTARALHATVELGNEIEEEHFGPVAAAIRFAEQMRRRAKGRGQ